MSETKVVVPEEMLNAAYKATRHRSEQGNILIALEAGLRWLSENPRMPTDEQERALIESNPNSWLDLNRRHLYFLEGWQRRCFLRSEEPEDHPILKEWLTDAKARGVDVATQVNYRRLFERAFAAGQESKFQFGATGFDPLTGCSPIPQDSSHEQTVASYMQSKDATEKRQKAHSDAQFHAVTGECPNCTDGTCYRCGPIIGAEQTRESFDTAFGRVVIDERVPPGEIRINRWDGSTLMKNIGQ